MKTPQLLTALAEGRSLGRPYDHDSPESDPWVVILGTDDYDVVKVNKNLKPLGDYPRLSLVEAAEWHRNMLLQPEYWTPGRLETIPTTFGTVRRFIPEEEDLENTKATPAEFPADASVDVSRQLTGQNNVVVSNHVSF